MVQSLAFVPGLGAVNILGGGWSTGPVIPPVTGGGTVVLSSNLEAATVSAPISREDMWAYIGATYGSFSNFTNTSVVSTTGPGGTSSKVLQQHFPTVVSGSTSNFAMPPTGTGIALTSTPLIGGAVDEASIEFDFRVKPTVANSGAPFGWGFKIPGLAGARPGTSVPTGGNPSPTGFSARLMGRRIGTTADANLQCRPVGYFYSPDLPAGAIGNDLDLGAARLTSNTWHHLRQGHRVNSVTTEGSTTPPANGIHRIWIDDVLVYQSTTTVYRFYTDANITHYCHDNFYGGSDTADAPNTWGPVVDADHQFDNLVIRTGAGAAS